MATRRGRGATERPKAQGIVPSGAKEPDEIPSLGRVLELLRLVWAVDHGLQLSSKRMAATIGVTGPQRLVIRIVGRFPGISAGRLATILHIDPSTLSGVLKRLESRALLERRADAWDRRRALLRLTQRGRSIDANSVGTVEEAVETALAGIPQNQLASAEGVLAALAEGLRSAPAKLPPRRSGGHAGRRHRA